MAVPLSTLIRGNLNIASGCDISLFGPGDLLVNNNVYINGTQNSINSSTGSLILPFGGLSVSQDSNFLGKITVNSTSNLKTTNIDTTLGKLNISGGNAVNINVSAASQFISYGTLTLNSLGGNTILQSNLNNSSAIQIISNNSGGGVNILANSGGIQGSTSTGSINLVANSGIGTFQVNSSVANQNLIFALNGATDSQLLLKSAGTNIINNAIQIQSTNLTGNIFITNNSIGTGSITNYAGSGGFNVITNTGGSIQLIANAASSFLVVNSSGGNGQSLTVGVNGAFLNSNLILQSESTNVTNAILIQTNNTIGGIKITNGPLSSGAVTINSGSGGLTCITQNGGGINLTGVGAKSSFVNKTNGNNQDLTISVQSNNSSTNGSNLILSNQVGGNVLINTISGGNIELSSSSQININSNASNGNGIINIGTLQTVPVKIGTSTSTTTILGNLNVQGTTTTIQSTVVQITDNIIQLNNGPTGTADSGIAVKRYQKWIDGVLIDNACTGISGDVISDVADNYNNGAYNITGLNSTTLSLSLDPNDINYNNPGVYNGYWIKILPSLASTTGSCQVRRIKNHTGSTVTIYNTQDEITYPNVPAQGHDFTIIPASGTLYALYPCQWVLSIYDSINSEWIFACSPMQNVSAIPPISHYINLHVNNLTANAININTLNNTTADSLGTFNLTDNSTLGVNLTLPNAVNYGIYFIMIRPTIATANRTHAIFAIGRLNSITNCGQVVRLIGVKGINGDNLDIQWLANSLPQVFYRPAPGGNTITNFTYKIMTI